MTQSSSKSPIYRLLAATPILACVVLMGMTTEIAIVLASAPAFQTTDLWTQCFGVVYIVWFWTTAGWVLHAISKLWRIRENCRRTLFPQAIGVVVVSIGVLVHCVSWGLYFKTGRLANFEAVRFLSFNFRYLWDYVSHGEPIQLVTASIVVLATFLAIPFLLRRSIRGLDNEMKNSRGVVAWFALLVLTLLTWKSIPAEPGSLQRANRRRALTQELHPSFTFLISYLESKSAADIRPTLDTTQLTRIEEYNRQKASDATPNPNNYSVIYVAIESLRYDTLHQVHQGIEILPNINRLTKQGVQLTHAYAQSTHSDYADVCLVSSLYPLRTRHHHYYDESDPWPKTLIYDVLKPHGYATAIISSQNEMWGGMANFLQSSNLDLFYHPETAGRDAVFQEGSPLDRGFAKAREHGSLKAGKFPDHHTTTRAIAWIREQAEQDRPYFLSMNFQSSHFPYLIPNGTNRPFQPCDLSSNISFASYPKSETNKVRNAYYNAIHECDRQVGRLVATLAELGRLDRTILVITGENGEAFHECGSVTHAREPVEPAIHVACVFHAPGLLKPRTEPYPFEHVDLVPTTLGLLGLPGHPNFQGIDVFSKGPRPARESRLTYCHVNTSFANCDAITLAGRWKLVIDRNSGERLLFDTQDDPNEEANLFEVRPDLAGTLNDRLETWRRNQLAYYHLPQYYLDFFPPKAPAWEDSVDRQEANLSAD